MSTGGAWASGSTPGLAVRASGPERLVDRLPSGVAAATVEAARTADVLVVDRRTADTRTERTGEAEIAGRTVLVVPKRPGARPRVSCYSRADPRSDPAVELVRRTVELDATADAHYGVASAVAVASGDEDGTTETDDEATWATTDEGAAPADDAFGLPAPDESTAPGDDPGPEQLSAPASGTLSGLLLPS